MSSCRGRCPTGSPPTYFEITADAVFSGIVEICIDYSNLTFNTSNLELFHQLPSGSWERITSSHDEGNQLICGETSSFSSFAVFELEDPVVLIEQLVEDVFVLNLNNGIENSLDTKLDRALAALIDANVNNDISAINALEAFINGTQAQSGILILEENAFIERFLPLWTVRQLAEEEMNSYRAPFTDVASRKPIFMFRQEVGNPVNRPVIQAYNSWLLSTDIPKLMFHFTPGAIMRAGTVQWARNNLSNLTVVDGGPGIHYVQEDQPELIAQSIVEWIDAHGLSASRVWNR